MSNDNNNSSQQTEEQICTTLDALWFDGQRSYVDCGKLSPFNVQEAITVEALVKRDEERKYHGHDGGHIVNMGGGWDAAGFSLFLYNENIRIELQNTSKREKTIVDNPPPPIDKWTHLAFTWSQKTQTIQVYMDGVLQPHKGTFRGPIGVPQQKLFIGLNETSGFHFKGFIKHIRIWNTVRTQEEIKDGIFQILEPQKNLVAQYILEKNVEESCASKCFQTQWSAVNIPFGKINIPNEDIGMSLKQMVNNPTASDVTFVVDGKPIYGHKCILMCRSDYMKSLLTGNMKEASLKEIQVKEISYDLFLKFIEFCYTDRFQPPKNMEDAISLLKVADEYAVKRMKSLVEVHLARMISISNVFDLLKVSDQYSAFQLQEICKAFIIQFADKLKGTPGYREYVLESSK